jgi:UDP-glucose 4-epimerase
MLAANRADVRRVVFAGSSSIYGDSPEMPRRETQRLNPLSPYATSKVAAEFYVHSLGALHGIETVVLRYFNVFGPGQDPDSEYAAVVPKFVTAAIRGERATIYGDGSQSRDFTYIDNVVLANLLAADAARVSGLTCNVGCGTSYSLIELFKTIESAVGTTSQPLFGPNRLGDVPHSLADISLASAQLGYRVVVPFEEGIRRTVAAYLETGDGRL